MMNKCSDVYIFEHFYYANDFYMYVFTPQNSLISTQRKILIQKQELETFLQEIFLQIQTMIMEVFLQEKTFQALEKQWKTQEVLIIEHPWGAKYWQKDLMLQVTFFSALFLQVS